MVERGSRKGRFGFLSNKELYLGLALLLIILTVLAAFTSDADPWPLLVLSGICFLAPSIDRIISLKASSSGIEAELQVAKEKVESVTDEAEKLLETLRQSAIQSAALSLELVQRSGWIGGFEEESKKTILDTTTATLRDAGVGESELDSILEQSWYRYESRVYMLSILGGSTTPDFGSPLPFDPSNEDERANANVFLNTMRDEWKAMRRRPIGASPSPEQLAEFIRKAGDDDPSRQDLLEDYRYFVDHKKHKRPAQLDSRRRIPAISVKSIPKS